MPRELSLESELMFLMAGLLQGPLRAASFPLVRGGEGREAPGPGKGEGSLLGPCSGAIGPSLRAGGGGLREGEGVARLLFLIFFQRIYSKTCKQTEKRGEA